MSTSTSKSTKKYLTELMLCFTKDFYPNRCSKIHHQYAKRGQFCMVHPFGQKRTYRREKRYLRKIDALNLNGIKLAVIRKRETRTDLTRRKSMKKGQTKRNRYSLGDLIAALFEETRKISSNRREQTLLVYAALSDLLKGKIHSTHPIALKA